MVLLIRTRDGYTEREPLIERKGVTIGVNQGVLWSITGKRESG